jgi:hypothetical protein
MVHCTISSDFFVYHYEEMFMAYRVPLTGGAIYVGTATIMTPLAVLFA